MNLPPLPPSSDKEFWEEADVNTNLTPQPAHTSDAHFFVRVTGRSAKCTHCDWGFDMDPGDKIKDGHLYDKSGKLVL